MAIGDLLKGVVSDVLQDMLKKATGSRRRKRRTRAKTPTERLRAIEKVLKPSEALPGRTRDGRFKKTRRAAPAKRQVSRRRTVRARSKTKRRAY